MKRFLIIVMALTLILSLSLTVVYAADEDPEGKTYWHAYFNGGSKDGGWDCNYAKNGLEFADELSAMQPGDTATFYMELRNDNPATTDWYMTNKVIESLEATRNAASQGAYSYMLTYDGPGGSTELFNSNTVGGTQTVDWGGDREGLEQATSALEGFFYLDTLASGQTGNITLRVKLDGETQGNAYQDTRAPLQMQFAVNLHRTTPGRNDITWNPVRTGDETNLLLWSGVMLGCGIAALALGVVVLRRNRKYKEENEDE